MKDKNRIINEMVASVADVLEAKAEELSILADIYTASGKTSEAWKTAGEIPEIRSAIKLLRSRAGTWA